MDKIEKKIDMIIKLINKELKPQKIILFGSRAKGNEYMGSDIDLCIEGAKKKNKRELRKLKEKVDEISGLYSVDIVIYEEIDENFRDIIIKTGKVIYEKN